MMRKPMADAASTATRSKTIPAPVGGWNAQDSIADMGPKDAVFLDNFFPRTTDVQLRLGSLLHATLPANREIRTLMGYKSPSAVTKLFAAANDGIYEVTAGGAIVSAAISATLGAWQWLQTTTAGGSFLIAVNGQDGSRLYNGTNWIVHSPTSTAQTISSITRVGTLATLTTAAPHGLVSNTQVTVSGASPSQYNGTFLITVLNATQFTYVMASDPGSSATVVGTYTIPFALTGSGISPTTVVNVSLFKSRVIFCVNDRMSFFYLPVNVLGGAASEFPLHAVCRKGGFVMATGSWTLDGGNGPDDYFVAITSEGECVIYKGTDPSSAANFALVGVFDLGQPIGRRCMLKAADDTYVLTKQAIYPLARALNKNDLDKRVMVTRKIEKAWSAATTEGATLFGWMPVLFPEQNMLLVNVPTLNYPTRNIIYSDQYVMNLTTGAWCRFQQWNSEAWLSFNSQLYFALHNKVMQGWTGNSDQGNDIVGSGKSAFNYFSRSGPKQIAMLRPLITASTDISLQLGIDMDFADNSKYSSTVSYSQVISQWDAAIWNQSKWNGNASVLKKWRTVASQVGRAASVRLRVRAKDVSMTWMATDFLIADASGEVMG
jgi:hypothetical protein